MRNPTWAEVEGYVERRCGVRNPTWAEVEDALSSELPTNPNASEPFVTGTVDPSADLLPIDKADESRILQAGYRLLEALAGRMTGARPEVTLQLGAAEWAALEAETRRIYRPHAAYKYTPHPEGIGAVRWVRAG